MAKTAQKTEVETEGPHKMWRVKVSGSYHNSKKEIVDFEDIEGVIPFCAEDVGAMHVQGRYIQKWLKGVKDEEGKPKYPDRCDNVRQVYVDDMVETTGTLSFVGKNIKELSVDEIQDLATAKDLRFIPLPQSGMSKREMLVLAYVAYADKILGKKVKYQEDKFNYAKLPAITLNADGRIEDMEQISNEEMIELEIETGKKPVSGEKDDPTQRFTIEELRTIADTKNIAYDTDTSFKELYSQLFNAG